MARRPYHLALGIAEHTIVADGGAVIRLVPALLPHAQIVGLLDQHSAMRAQVAHGLRIIVCPLEAVRFFLPAPGDRVEGVAFRAGNVVPEPFLR
ncbi:hypothetical protein D3C72_2253230 [compost metagenome]